MALFSQKQKQNQNQQKSIKKQSGFTLIELVTVIIILGVLSVGISSFLKFGTQIFVDATGRDKILSSARFAIERLNRELRNAVPNSSRAIVYNGNNCLEFTPLAQSFVYVDVPVSPEAERDTATLVPTNTSFTAQESDNYFVAVYPLNSDEVYKTIINSKVFPLKSGDFTSTPYTLTFFNDIAFHEDSTTQRLFIMENAAMYCHENSTQLVRYDIDGHDSAGIISGTSNRAVMAEDLNAVTFTTDGGTRLRNGTVEIHFEFSRNDEVIRFNNEIQVPNVP